MPPEIQHIAVSLPEGQQRIETGALQVNGDWPGVFIRGYSALYLAMQLVQVIDVLKDHNSGPFVLGAMEGLKQLLVSCDVRGEAHNAGVGG